jgi:ABC-2 type transport system ATP-binding protein
MTGGNAIEVEGLRFDYPGVRALEAVSFTVARGSVTALVGPNGAGKTTLLRCIAALERPMLGAIRVAGIDVLEEPRACHRRVGFLADSYGLYDALTIHQCLV